MARYKGKYLIGAIGPITLRLTKKGVIGSIRVKDVKQTEATKRSANFFGKVVSFAGLLRANLQSLGQQDSGLMNRLNKEMMAVFQQCYNKQTGVFNFSNNYFSRLNGIDLNADSALKENLWPLPSITLRENQLTVGISDLNIAENLKFPDGATHCKLQVLPLQFDLTGGHYRKMEIRSLLVKRNNLPLQIQDFLVEVVPGTLCVIGLGLHYYKEDSGIFVMLNKPDFSPSVLIHAGFNEGTFSETLTESVRMAYADGSESIKTTTTWSGGHAGF